MQTVNNTPKLSKGIMKMEIASKKEDTLKRLMKSMELYRQGEAADAIEFIVSRDGFNQCNLYYKTDKNCKVVAATVQGDKVIRTEIKHTFLEKK
jgi:hypothetical protein